MFTCQDISFIIRTGLWAERPWDRGFIPRKSESFAVLHSFQTGSGAHPASYPMGTGGSFPSGVKRQGREADPSPPSSTEVMNTWIYTFTAPYFMA
jgi:hypothetical protein